MWFLVAIVLVVLGLFSLALRGFFGRFPDNWEWIGIILAGVGLAMGAPTIFSMLWGRPIVKAQFEKGMEGAERFLIVYLANPPMKSWVLRKLGVRRGTVQSLKVQFRISEAGSNKIITPIRQARIYSDDDSTDCGRDRIALPPTFSVAASIIVVKWDTNGNKAFVTPDRLRQPTMLEPGMYRVDLILLVDGDPMRMSRQLVVGQKADDLDWVKTS